MNSCAAPLLSHVGEETDDDDFLSTSTTREYHRQTPFLLRNIFRTLVGLMSSKPFQRLLIKIVLPLLILDTFVGLVAFTTLQ